MIRNALARRIFVRLDAIRLELGAGVKMYLWLHARRPRSGQEHTGVLHARWAVAAGSALFLSSAKVRASSSAHGNRFP